MNKEHPAVVLLEHPLAAAASTELLPLLLEQAATTVP